MSKKPQSTLEDYAYLWSGGAAGDWILLRSQKSGLCTPYNLGDKNILLIEKDDLAFQIVERMIREGVRVLNRPPVPKDK